MVCLVPSRQRDGYARGKEEGMQFEELVEGYEDSPVLGTLVAMWRQASGACTGMRGLVWDLCVVLAAYAAMWVACAWAAL